MIRKSLVIAFFLLSSISIVAQETEVQYLSGTDKDHTVQWEFNCSKGMNSGRWTTIAVPSNWEQQGFGAYNYGHDKIKSGEIGLYRHNFQLGKESGGKKIFIVFEGAMTDTEVQVNGQLAGPVHQGGFYRFKYDITALVKFGSGNLLEVKVSKQSANASVNRAERDGDFWALSGIYRPVYLEIMPATYIDRVAINATADGLFKLDVFAGNPRKGDMVVAQVQTLDGKNVAESFSVPLNTSGTTTSLQKPFNKPALWNPEAPNLYQVKVSLRRGNQTIHSITQRFGFRTAELRPNDGFYVNNTRVIFKGVNRHSAWPLTGRTLSKEISLLDVKLMKEMNMNAVRMSHYPPDQHFLDVCDSLGLFVLDELTGWQAAYDTIAGRPLVKELVVRDVNHPSVVMWANGNEGGWNRALDNDFKLYDPQNRLVYHPWEKFNGTDTKHYPDYNYVVNSALYNKEVFFPTEFMHGLYDGGHGAGLEDFWNGILAHPYGTGGFLWSFSDEGIVRMDKDSVIDTDGNHAPDGIVGPYREKEGSFYTIKELWSPVYISQQSIPKNFDGRLGIENRYLNTNLDQCRFEWRLVNLPLPHDSNTSPKVMVTGTAPRFSLKPGEKGKLFLQLPPGFQKYHALYLSAYDRTNNEVFTWSWSLEGTPASSALLPASTPKASIKAGMEGTRLVIRDEALGYYFDTSTGMLSKVSKGSSDISLSNGPVVAGVKYNLKELKHYRQGEQYIVEPLYAGESFVSIRWTFTPGQPLRLDYSYNKKGEAAVMGISFNYPEEKINGMRWLGRGPYRVWKNRLKGQQFGVWQKKYNNTITGESWQYPEFKGFHADVRWVVVETREANFTVYSEAAPVFLQMLKPQKPVGATNDNTDPSYAEGNLGFLDAISPIGTKFQAANKLGPQSQSNMQLNYNPVKGTLLFDFR